MNHQELYDLLLKLLNPLTLKVLFQLDTRPHTKTELYSECSNWNNTVVKDACDLLQSLKLVSGGTTRGDNYRLTLKGVSLVEWLQEGAILVE